MRKILVVAMFFGWMGMASFAMITDTELPNTFIVAVIVCYGSNIMLWQDNDKTNQP